ncbi:MAG: glutathione peroxidase [Miltoncostaeaceae bacterium]
MRSALPALVATAAVAALAVLPAGASASTPVIPAKQRGKPVLTGTYQRLDGKRINLSRLRGRVVLVVNTASHCGFASQYGPLESLWRERRTKGVSVVGVPSNDFKQEYPSDLMVKRFCKRNFGVSFPMLRISKVTGAKAIPLFRGLASPSWSSQPQWNFNKYLVDTKGRPAMYFPSSEEPGSPAMTKAIDALLAERSA